MTTVTTARNLFGSRFEAFELAPGHGQPTGVQLAGLGEGLGRLVVTPLRHRVRPLAGGR